MPIGRCHFPSSASKYPNKPGISYVMDYATLAAPSGCSSPPVLRHNRLGQQNEQRQPNDTQQRADGGAAFQGNVHVVDTGASTSKGQGAPRTISQCAFAVDG